MAKKTTDKRPSRQKQKERTHKNKVKQLKAHLEKFPKDENAKKKLEFVQSSKSRFRTNAHPTAPILYKTADGKVKRDIKDKQKKR